MPHKRLPILLLLTTLTLSTRAYAQTAEEHVSKTKNIIRFQDVLIGYNHFIHIDWDITAATYNGVKYVDGWVTTPVSMTSIGYKVGKKQYILHAGSKVDFGYQWTWFRADIAFSAKELAVKLNALNPGLTALWRINEETALEVNTGVGLSFIASHFETAPKYFNMRGFPGVVLAPEIKLYRHNMNFNLGYTYNKGFDWGSNVHRMNLFTVGIGFAF